jgi:AraC-like DNA-binding protein
MKYEHGTTGLDTLPHTLSRSLFRFELGYVQPIDKHLARCGFHHHHHTELVYHRQGSGTTALDNGRKVAFDQGGVIIYPPGMVHNQVTVLPACDVVIHVAALGPALFDPHECLYVPPPHEGYVLELIAELGETPSQVDPNAGVGLSLKASLLMHCLLSRCRRAGASEAALAGRDTLVARAADFIRLRYRAVRRMSDVADGLGVDYHRLRREFREAYGYTMKQYLRRVRLKQARVLLRNTVLPQSVIADLCGYADEHYFSCDFRKQTGGTPGTFRRAVRQRVP